MYPSGGNLTARDLYRYCRPRHHLHCCTDYVEANREWKLQIESPDYLAE